MAFEPADEVGGVKHPLTPGAPDFSRGAAHLGIKGPWDLIPQVLKFNCRDGAICGKKDR
ncbi:MAG: hypothetical protein HA489_05340 [Archaeoglobales archaeon]|nr:hypothetical protein [Archaeoglobales archaeon]